MKKTFNTKELPKYFLHCSVDEERRFIILIVLYEECLYTICKTFLNNLSDLAKNLFGVFRTGYTSVSDEDHRLAQQ